MVNNDTMFFMYVLGFVAGFIIAAMAEVFVYRHRLKNKKNKMTKRFARMDETERAFQEKAESGERKTGENIKETIPGKGRVKIFFRDIFPNNKREEKEKHEPEIKENIKDMAEIESGLLGEDMPDYISRTRKKQNRAYNYAKFKGRKENGDET